MLTAVAFALLTATPGLASAQQNPPGIAWDVLRTERVEIVYPHELAAEAQRVARHMERVARPVTASLGGPAPRISLVLQNQGVTSNGFVTLAPRRSEWFSPPPQMSGFLGANEWYELLGTHEYRHVAQFDRTRVGFTGFVSALAGQPGWALMSDIALPRWFWEGDAVGIETAITTSGRGRMPDFDMEQRSLAQGTRRPDYWTAFWRSYDTNVPDHYQLGYGIVSYVKLTQGRSAWDSVVTRASRNAWLPWSFSAAMRSVTGKGAAETYNAAMDSLLAQWRADRSPLPQTAVAPLHGLDPLNFTWTENPQFTGDGRVIAFRRGIDIAYGMVAMPAHAALPPDTNAVRAANAVNDSVVTTLFTPAPYASGVPHSVAGTQVAWAAVVYDVRWAQREWSDIRVTDLTTGATREVTHHGKLFAPALSPDGKRIAAVEFSTARRTAVVILDAQTGAEQFRLPNAGNDFVQVPRWSPDGAHLVFVRIATGVGRAIVWADVATGIQRDVLGPTYDNVQNAVTDGTRIYYSSPWNGVDNIYATAIATGRTWLVTNRPVSAFNPAVSPDGRTLAFNEMTSFGEIVVSMPLDSSAWVPIEAVPRHRFAWAEALAAQEGGVPPRDTAAAAPFPTEPYSTLGRSLNFYGLTAYASPVDSRTSLSLVSRDVLGTTSLAIGVRGNRDERTVDYGATATYAGWWPVLSAALWRNQRASDYVRASGSPTAPTLTIVPYRWTEIEATVGARLPFQLTRGLYSTRLSVGATLSARRSTDTPVNFRVATGERLKSQGTFIPLAWDLSFGRGYATYRDVQPVWGQYLVVSYQHTPFAKSVMSGALLAARGYLFFPGLLRHNGILVEGGWEQQYPGNYFFSSQMAFPRGYSAASYDRFTKVGVNYAFPLAYPDQHLLGAVQVQRVRANLFYDFGRGEILPSVAFPSTIPAAQLYNSMGIELMTDTWWWQIPTPVGIGVRGVWLQELRQFKTAFLLQLGF